MPAIDLFLFVIGGLIVGCVIGHTIGYRKGKQRGDAEGDARCHDLENRLKELQQHAKELMGIDKSP